MQVQTYYNFEIYVDYIVPLQSLLRSINIILSDMDFLESYRNITAFPLGGDLLLKVIRRENLKTHCRPTIAKWKFLVENSPIKYFLVKVRDRLICLKLGPVRRRLKSLLSINKAHSFET